MTWSFIDWSPDDSAGHVLDLTEAGAWDRLSSFYTRDGESPPLARVIEIAQAHGVQSIVVERRYIDLDWRSEHARFYGHTFKRYPSISHRLHFFTEQVPPSLTNLGQLQSAYRGYSVMRPLPATPVGRTMIAPPPELDDGVCSGATDTVDLFGWPLTIRAMPFVSQDAEYLRCAHASLWMVLYHLHLAHRTNRCLPEDVHDASMGGHIVGRQVPSEGLSISQMLAAATQLGLSPGLLDLPASRAASERAGSLSLYGIICRYINSQLPPIVISDSHAWVLVAYKRVPSSGSRYLHLWRHDDARGPYIPVDDPWHEVSAAHRPWRAAILPLLPKMYVTAERAEAAGRFWISNYAQSDVGAGGQLAKVVARDDVAYRTYAVRSRDYKEGLLGRGIDPELARLYMLANWPKYVWITEAVDRTARDVGERRPDVLGEVVFDSTTSTLSAGLHSGLLALHCDDFAYRTGPDYGQHRRVQLAGSGRYLSGRWPVRA